MSMPSIVTIFFQNLLFLSNIKLRRPKTKHCNVQYISLCQEQMNRIFQQEHRPKLMKNIENSEIVSRAKSTLDQSLSKEINTSRERGGLNREPG